MTYNREIVRRKAVLCLCSFLRKVPDMAMEIRPLVRRSLGDHDPGVVWAAVEVYQQLAIVGSCYLLVVHVFKYIYIYQESLLFFSTSCATVT